MRLLPATLSGSPRPAIVPGAKTIATIAWRLPDRVRPIRATTVRRRSWLCVDLGLKATSARLGDVVAECGVHGREVVARCPGLARWRGVA